MSWYGQRSVHAPTRPAPDACTRLLPGTLWVHPPDTAAVWHEVEPYLRRTTGLLILDDTTLDKPYARNMELVTRHGHGTQHQGGAGSTLWTLVWTDGTAPLPGDCRIYATPLPDGHTTNAHFRAMFMPANSRQLAPRCGCFDRWSSRLDTLKAVRSQGGQFRTRLTRNHLIPLHWQGNVPVATGDSAEPGRQVHLKGVGFMLVFRMVAPHGDAHDWATNELRLTAMDRAGIARQCWASDPYQRGRKQCCGVERTPVRTAAAPWQHSLLAVRALVHGEVQRLHTGIHGDPAKASILRDAIRQYCAHPTMRLDATA